MINLVEEKLQEIEKLCQKFKVRRLELFGSAANGEFDMRRSDIDFLVEFNEEGIENYADCYFGLLEALEKVLGYSVDLVVFSAIKNPYFIQSIENSRELLYAA